MTREPENWNLSSLYASFDDPAFVKDVKACEQAVSSLDAWCNDLGQEVSGSVIADYLQRLEHFRRLHSKIMRFSELSVNANSKNEQARHWEGRASELVVAIQSSVASFRQCLVQLSSLEEMTKELPLLEEHGFFLLRERARAMRQLSPKEEKLVKAFGLYGATSWSRLHRKVVASATVDETGEDGELHTVPLPVIQCRLRDPAGARRGP